MIYKGNIIIIHMDNVEPSMAIIPKIDFQQCKISDIFNKIEKLHTQFPTCNFKHTSLVFEDKYRLNNTPRYRNMSLSKWFHSHHIHRDNYNNYIFYVESSSQPKSKPKSQTKRKRKPKKINPEKPEKKNNKSKKEKY
jgi:hypothetical protein